MRDPELGPDKHFPGILQIPYTKKQTTVNWTLWQLLLLQPLKHHTTRITCTGASGLSFEKSRTIAAVVLLCNVKYYPPYFNDYCFFNDIGLGLGLVLRHLSCVRNWVCFLLTVKLPEEHELNTKKPSCTWAGLDTLGLTPWAVVIWITVGSSTARELFCAMGDMIRESFSRISCHESLPKTYCSPECAE